MPWSRSWSIAKPSHSHLHAPAPLEVSNAAISCRSSSLEQTNQQTLKSGQTRSRPHNVLASKRPTIALMVTFRSFARVSSPTFDYRHFQLETRLSLVTRQNRSYTVVRVLLTVPTTCRHRNHCKDPFKTRFPTHSKIKSAHRNFHPGLCKSTPNSARSYAGVDVTGSCPNFEATTARSHPR